MLPQVLAEQVLPHQTCQVNNKLLFVDWQLMMERQGQVPQRQLETNLAS